MNAKQGLDSDCVVVHSFSDEEIKDAQYEILICWFLKMFHEHIEKPHARLLASEPSEVKILCSLWKQFKTVDEILYRVGKTSVDPWRLVIPRSIQTKILEILHNSKWAGHPGMIRMKSSIGLRFYWPRMRLSLGYDT